MVQYGIQILFSEKPVLPSSLICAEDRSSFVCVTLYIYTKTHGVTSHKTITVIMTIVRISKVNCWWKLGGKKGTRQPCGVQLWDFWIQVLCVTDALITPVELGWFRINWTVSQCLLPSKAAPLCPTTLSICHEISGVLLVGFSSTYIHTYIHTYTQRLYNVPPAETVWRRIRTVQTEFRTHTREAFMEPFGPISKVTRLL